MIDRGIYKIKDQFFEDFPDENLKENKGEKRPCYYCFRDTRTVLILIRKGVKFFDTQADVLKIEKELLTFSKLA